MKRKITWKSDGKNAYLQIADANWDLNLKTHSTFGKKRYVKRRREIGRQKEDEINYLARNVHLDDGVRRMSFFTGLLLFFSHSFTSLHDDWRFEKTILDDDASFTDGINNITFNSLIIFYFFTIIVWYQFSFDNLFFSLRFWLITQFLNVTLLAFIKFILIKLRIFK